MNKRLVSALLLAIGSVLVTSGIALLSLGTTGIVRAEPQLDIEPFEDFACLDCHTDENRLNELAPPIAEEPEESLSSGPG